MIRSEVWQFKEPILSREFKEPGLRHSEPAARSPLARGEEVPGNACRSAVVPNSLMVGRGQRNIGHCATHRP